MKITALSFFAVATLALSAFGQTPPEPPPAVPSATAAIEPPSATPAIAATPVATPRQADDLESRIERKARKHGVSISFGDHDKRHADRDDDADVADGRHSHSDSDDAAWMAVPIVGVIFTTLFGAPVLIVGLIMFFSFWK